MSTDQLREALQALLKRDERNTCRHEETHRGGGIWTICDGCGRQWADDRGGKPEWVDPPEWIAARAALASTAALAQQGEPIIPIPSDRDRDTVLGAVNKARNWLAENCHGEPPRPSIALLATLADEVLAAHPSPAAPQGQGEPTTELNAFVSQAYMALYGNSTAVMSFDSARPYFNEANPDWLCIRFNTSEQVKSAHAALRELERWDETLSVASRPTQPAAEPGALSDEQIVAGFDAWAVSPNGGNFLPKDVQRLRGGNYVLAVEKQFRAYRAGALLAAQPTKQAVSEPAWQLIDTAPKDGTYILVTNDRGDGSWIAHWAPVATSGYRFDQPWRSVMLNHWHIAEGQRYLPPTHWRPIPRLTAASEADSAAKGE